MLSRTADNLYWLARYMERAETAARLLEVGARIALMPNAGHGYRSEWDALLRAVGTSTAFAAKYGEPGQRNIESHLFFDHDNPSSVASCITRARENGRIVRTALTTQVWDALNTAFQELRELERTPRGQLSLSRLTDWTMRNCALVRGAIDTTLLRNDGYDFLNIGYALERADNTARLLDVKYYVLLPSAMAVGTNIDNVQWQTILRSVSAEGGFQMTYGQDARPREIAQFLMLDKRMPRSLAFCMDKIRDNLGYLVADYGRRLPCHDLCDRLALNTMSHSIDQIIEMGLHEFITDFLKALAELGGQTEIDYRFYS